MFVLWLTNVKEVCVILTKTKYARLKKGMKQRTAAELLNVSRTWLSLVECARVPPSDELLNRMAGLYDVPLKELHERVI